MTDTDLAVRNQKERDEMTAFGVHSEVGKLRKVIVHRPDLSLKRLTPGNHDDLLFDDVLWVEQAQREHDLFVGVLRSRGAEVYYTHELLAETLAASDEAKCKLVEAVASPYTVGWSIADEIKQYCKSQLAHYKVPRYVKFVESFPQTVTGKIQKFKIRDLMKEELGLEELKTA